MKDQQVPANVAEVDCTKEAKLCEKHQIRGYPSIKVFRSEVENILDYSGARDTENILDFLKRQSLPAVNKMKPMEVKPFTEKFKVVVVATLPPGHKAVEVFEKTANKLRDSFVFASTESGTETSIALYKKFDEGLAQYKGNVENLKEEELIAWIEEESLPLMDEIGPENYTKYMSAKKPMAYLFYENEEQRKNFGEITQKVMKKYKGKVNAIFINAATYGQHADSLNLDKQWPGFVIDDIKENLKYPLTGKGRKELTLENLESFMKDFVNGTLKPVFKSEPIPKDDKAAVKTVVHDNFKELVLDNKKDVFLEIYAPWCGACKRIADDYEKLAQKYAPHSDKIIIAKMDGTLNDLPKDAKFTLEHFPTLLLYKATSNELVEMKKLGNVNDFIDFISANASNKVEVSKEDIKEDAEAEVEELEEPLPTADESHDEL